MNRDRYIQLCYEVVDCLHNLTYHESKGRGVGDDQWQVWRDKQLALLTEAKTMIDSEMSEKDNA